MIVNPLLVKDHRSIIMDPLMWLQTLLKTFLHLFHVILLFFMVIGCVGKSKIIMCACCRSTSAEGEQDFLG